MKKVIEWNWNDLQSIKRAERLKTVFENKGYTLLSSYTNPITQEAKSIYLTNKI